MRASPLRIVYRSALFTALAASLVLAQSAVSGCSHPSSSSGSPPSKEPPGGPPAQRIPGQTSFQSAPMLGRTPYLASAGGGGITADAGASLGSSSGGSGSGSGGGANPAGGGSAAPRTVQETDIYRVDGNRLYYLNSYRGLMVFDVTNPDTPALLGRSPIFGTPEEMFVQNGIAIAVVADWYGVDASGAPFYGSIVRGLDATDPANIKPIGEVQLRGWVQDTRVVGSVLYLVTQDYGWEYGWYGGGSSSTPKPPTVAIASVSFSGAAIKQAGYQEFPNATGGVFNVTPNSIMLGSASATNGSSGGGSGSSSGGGGDSGSSTTTSTLQYVDISDPAGAIKLRGSIVVNGALTGWGPDNGRWNLDFADGVTAHALGCGSEWCGSTDDSYLLSTVDFTNPDAPKEVSELAIPNLGWSAAARFSGTTLYLSPNGYYPSSLPDGGMSNQTPFSIYDLSTPAAPKLAGSTNVAGSVWMYIPDGTHLFSIGNTNTNYWGPAQVDVQYLDVSNPASPSVLSSVAFGSGWSWSPAEDTFKAFTVDDTRQLAIVPFSGWDPGSGGYQNGVELMQYTGTGIVKSGAARTKGWAERGIFVNNRLYSLSDQALASIDYTDPANPKVMGELTLARNVVSATPQGATIAEVSSDWWGNDTTTSEVRVLPLANADETTDDGKTPSTNVAGVDAQVFQNGSLAYVVTQVSDTVACPGDAGAQAGGCQTWTQQVSVVDTSNGAATPRGTIKLPDVTFPYYGWGWGGFYWDDWYDGAAVAQVNGITLAFRRWNPQYSYDPTSNSYTYLDTVDALFVIDLSNPDAPALASTAVTEDPYAWWGDLQVAGSNLYATHYEWVNRPDPSAPSGVDYYVKYYLDPIDLSDLAHPKVGGKINVPGVLVGGSAADPSILYTVDYRWDANDNPVNELDVVKLDGGLAYLQSVTTLDGWVGNVIIQGTTAYASAQQYDWADTYGGPNWVPPFVELHEIDLSNPSNPADHVATDPASGWGWLLGVVGDRAVVTSGWGGMGVDVYRLPSGAAPVYEQSVRMNGWISGNVARQGGTLYLPTGYWGVQPVVLQ